jgi:hypothetical protein
MFIAFLSVTPITASKEISRSPEFVEQTSNSWNVYLNVIPNTDGSSLNIDAQDVSVSCPSNVFFRVWYGGFATFMPIILSPNPANNIENLGEEPASYLNLPSAGDDSRLEAFGEYPGIPAPGNPGRYVSKISNFFPLCQNPPCTEIQVGRIEVICDSPQLSTRTTSFRRYVSSGSDTTIVSPDALAELKILSSTLSMTSQFVIVISSNGLPALPPSDVVPMGPAYVFNSSDVSNSSDEDMYLSLHYSAVSIGNVDPLSVRIFEWTPAEGESGIWRDVGEQRRWHNGNQRVISKTTKNFTTYMLAISPRWCDNFSDTEGLNLERSINITTENKLTLKVPSQPGMALSRAYNPPMMFDAWKSITYTAHVSPEATLTISVLDGSGNIVMGNVNSGDSLTNINPSTYPSLTLRAEMSPTPEGTSPELLEWCLLIEPHFH